MKKNFMLFWKSASKIDVIFLCRIYLKTITLTKKNLNLRPLVTIIAEDKVITRHSAL